MLEVMLRGVTETWRTLRRTPAATGIVVLILASGIAVAATAFSAMRAGYLNALPYRDQARLVLLHGTAVRTDTVQQWETLARSYDQIAFLARGTGDVPSGAVVLEVRTADVSSRFFPMLGVNAAAGRLFVREEFQGSAATVAVVSNLFAEKYFGSIHNAIGQFVVLDGVARQVVGAVHAKSIPLPYQPIDIWLPMVQSRPRYADAIAVLRNHLSAADAQSEALLIARGLSPEDRPATVTVTGLKDAIVRESKLTLALVMAATLLLLIVICSNSASLMLVQIAVREKELAIRAALGATHWRLLRQIANEVIIITACATGLAVPLSYWLTRSIESVYPAEMPRISAINVTGPVLAFILLAGIGASVLIMGVLFVIARRFASFASLTERMITRRLSSRRGLFPALVAGEVAITVILLIGAGLLAESFLKIAPFKPGFEYANRVVFRVVLPGNPDPAAAYAHLRSLMDDASRSGTVVDVTAVSELPLSDTSWVPNVWMDGNLIAGRRSSTFVHCRAALGNYFQLMAIPIIQGRSFGMPAAREHVAIVNQAFAQRFADAAQILGKDVDIDIDGQKVGFVIIGVAGNVRMFAGTTAVEPELYIPLDQFNPKRVNLIAKAQNASEATVAGITALLTKNSGPRSVISARPMARILSDGMEIPKTRTTIFSLIAAFAVLLTAAGIYGILSWSTEVRVREIGIRAALGARRSQLMMLVVGHAISISAIGIPVGVICALLARGLVASLLYDTNPADPKVIVAAAVVTMMIAAAASAIPARRATKIEPALVMKSE